MSTVRRAKTLFAKFPSPPLKVHPTVSVQSVRAATEREEDKVTMIRNLNRTTLLILWLSCGFKFKSCDWLLLV